MKWFKRKQKPITFRLLYENSEPCGSDEYERPFSCKNCYSRITVCLKRGITLKRIAESIMCPHCGCRAIFVLHSGFAKLVLLPPPLFKEKQ